MAEEEKVIIDVSTPGAKEAQRELTGVTEALKDQTDALESTSKEQSSYNKTLGDTIKETKVFGVSVNSLTGAFKSTVGQIRNSVTGLKAFKVALAATGIGLIVVALGSLVTLFTKTQGGMDLVTKATNLLGTALDVVIDRLIMFGEGLIEFFSGNFSVGIDKMASSFKGLGDEIAADVKASNELSDATAKLEREQIAFIVTNAKLRKELKEYNREAENINNTLEERLKFSQLAEQAEEKRIKEALRLAAEELRIVEARNALGTSTNEDLRREAELRAELFRLQEESEERLTTQGNKTRLLQQQIQAQSIEVNQSIIASETQAIDQLANLDAIRLQNIELSYGKRKDLADDLAAYELKLEEQTLNSRLGILADGLGAFARLAGQNTQAGKTLAVAQATINAYLGVSGVWSAFANPALPPFTLFGAIAQTATTAALALANVKQILSVPIPKVQIESTPFADGGFIGGRSHAQGGTWINAEKGEYIISKDRMRIPSVRRSAMALNNYKQSGSGRYALGGEILAGADPLAQSLNRLENIMRQPQIVLPIEDLNTVQTRVQTLETRSTLS